MTDLRRSLGGIGKPLVNLVRGRPVMAVFEINLRCNSRCGYCDLPLNEGRYEMSRDPGRYGPRGAACLFGCRYLQSRLRPCRRLGAIRRPR